jgi:hypothetical protein
MRTSLMDVAECLIDFLSFFESKLLSSSLEDLLHGYFGIAVEPYDPTLRIESRI